MKKFTLTLCCLGVACLAHAQIGYDSATFKKVYYPGFSNRYVVGEATAGGNIYGTWGSSFPFLAGNLIIQGGRGNNDVVIATGVTPTTSLVVAGNTNIGIGDKPEDNNRLDVKLNTGLTAIRTLTADGHFIRISPSFGKGAYNNIVQSGDQAIIYSNGAVNTGAFVIAPQTLNNTSGLRMDANGNVAIGTATTSEKLSVKGTIVAMKVKVTATGWADFVFQPDYKLPSLQETEAYINEHKHLPDIPSAADIAKDGQDVGEMNKILLQKLEEMTLHMIRLQKEVDELKARK